MPRTQLWLWAALIIFVALVVVFLFSTWAHAQVAASDFTIVVLPDPQNETQNYPQVLNSQLQWIVDNQKFLNIQFVLTEGDNINDGADPAQLQTLDAAFRLLDNAGIPYLLATGNHDYNDYNPKISRDLTGFDQWFGPARYSGKAFFQGHFPQDSNANSYAVVTINGQQYLFMTLEYRPTMASLDWAESILTANTDKETFVVTHSFVLKNNMREDLCDDQDMPAGINATGQETWMRLRKFPNVNMVISGHFTGGSGGRRADLGDNGNLVNQLFADYQDYTNGGNGWLRIMTYHPATDTVSVQTYSPFLDKYMTDATNQFTLNYHNPYPNTGMGSISGKVRAKSGCAAIAGASVRAGTVSTTTASDGSYRLSVPPGSYSVGASAATWLTGGNNEKVSDSLTTQMNFYLSPASSCVASTVGVKVCSPSAGSTINSPVRFVAAATSTLPITTIMIYIDNKSVFQVKSSTLDVSLAVNPGLHNVVLQAWDSSGAVFKTPVSITVSSAPTPTPLPSPSPTPMPSPTATPTPTPTATPAPTPSPTPTPTPSGTGWISGKVTNISNGSSVSGVTVSAGPTLTISDASGNYLLSSVPAGTYNVTASKSGWLPLTKTATVNAGTNTPLNFAISTAGKISGTVKNARGAGVSGATVTFKGGTLANMTSAKTSATGTYSSAWIPVGNYSVTLSMTGHTTQTKSAAVNSGATTTLNFTNF